jgi:methyltransferase (TIGR00027 family)
MQPDKGGTPTDAKGKGILKARRRRASKTAQTTLRWRAIESLRPDDQRICSDLVASMLIGPFWARMAGIGFFKRRLIRALDKEDTGIANFVVARTRYIDDLLKAQIEEGINQLVILGAGYDTRAYRIPRPEGKVRVFELDDVATLKLKVARVKIALRSFPKNIVFVPIDFNREKLEERLFQSGYNKNLKTFFIWEGVTTYLTPEAVDQTLVFIARNSGPGSSVVFDYYFESVVDGTSDSTEARKLRESAARMGEPLLFGINSDRLESFLSSRGFDLAQHRKAESLKEMYFKGKGQQRKVFPLTAIASARVRYPR